MIILRTMTMGDLPIFKKWLYMPHVEKWYHDPLEWINEIEKQDNDFHWLHHYIVEQEGESIGFCQYYACKDSDESWAGYTALGGFYSLDYMIGETDFLRKGLGKQILAALIEKIKSHQDARRIVVQPEQENAASCGLLRSCGFILDVEKNIYVITV